MNSERPPWLDAALLDAEAFGLDFPRGTRGAAAREIPRGAAEPAANPVTTPRAAEAALDAIAREVEACRACSLGACRTRSVPGQGSAQARLFFVGEAPGAEEDSQGLPFVGAAGQLLTKMIAAIGLAREQVFIANVLKCRPPENRDPAPAEMAACRAFLMRQIESVDPDVIVTLGAHATRSLLQREGPLARMRGERHRCGRAELVVTYHPAYLLRSPDMKRAAWEDLKRAKSLLDAPSRA